jgi:hypothetical protein
MTRITIDSETRSKLDGLREPAEVCDESGNKLGYFVPPGLLKYLSPYSDAEIEELRKQRTGRPLKEILRDLGSRP